jgi:hypothetical protein
MTLVIFDLNKFDNTPYNNALHLTKAQFDLFLRYQYLVRLLL